MERTYLKKRQYSRGVTKDVFRVAPSRRVFDDSDEKPVRKPLQPHNGQSDDDSSMELVFRHHKESEFDKLFGKDQMAVTKSAVFSPQAIDSSYVNSDNSAATTKSVSSPEVGLFHSLEEPTNTEPVSMKHTKKKIPSTKNVAKPNYLGRPRPKIKPVFSDDTINFGKGKKESLPDDSAGDVFLSFDESDNVADSKPQSSKVLNVSEPQDPRNCPNTISVVPSGRDFFLSYTESEVDVPATSSGLSHSITSPFAPTTSTPLRQVGDAPCVRPSPTGLTPCVREVQEEVSDEKITTEKSPKDFSKVNDDKNYSANSTPIAATTKQEVSGLKSEKSSENIHNDKKQDNSKNRECSQALDQSKPTVIPLRKRVDFNNFVKSFREVKLNDTEGPAGEDSEEELFERSPELINVKGGKNWRRTLYWQKIGLGSPGGRQNRRTSRFLSRRISTVPDPSESLAVENDISILHEKKVEKSLRRSTLFRQGAGKTDNQTMLPEVPFAELYDEEMLRQSRKVGEGTFGEVFLLASSETAPPVLKIVPVGGDIIVNNSEQTKLEDMLAEIAVSTELTRLQPHAPNFVELRKCQMARGSYPPIFLELWDKYDEENESENDRPDCFPVDQLFVAIEFANGGKDLERMELRNAAQGFAIFSQVAFSLGVAEERVQFEHRDLHWGNILVRATEESALEYTLSGESHSVETHDVVATIIDFSLSRLTNPSDGTAIYNNLSEDPTLFTAKGDYQFDIYRKMRAANGNSWEEFKPITNVFWLHYLLDKLTSEVFYKNKKSKKHKSYLAKMRAIKARILDYECAKDVAVHESGE